MNSNTNNSNNNSYSERNTNTRSLQFYMDIESAYAPTTLVLGYWNSMISVRIHPALPEANRSGNNVFDYEQKISTALSLEKALALSEFIGKELIVDDNSNHGLSEPKSFAVPVSGGTTLVIVGVYPSNDEEKSPIPFLQIVRVDEHTYMPKEQITYNFNSLNSVVNYTEQGSFDMSLDLWSELRLFKRFLDASIHELTMAGAHASRATDAFFRDRLMEAVGAQTGGGRRGGNQRNRNIFDRQNKGNDLAKEEKIQNASEIEGLMG